MPEKSPFPKPENDSEYFENMVRSVFVVGFSRKVVDDKWDGFRSVFNDFDIDRVASWNEGDVLEAVESAKIIRNIKKIEATVHNARQLQTIIKEYGNIRDFVRSFDEMDHEAREKKLGKNFKWMGPMATRIFLYTSGETVSGH